MGGGKGKELKVMKITGFDENSVIVVDLPRIEGVVMTHELYLGSFKVVSGWQWDDRKDSCTPSRRGFCNLEISLVCATQSMPFTDCMRCTYATFWLHAARKSARRYPKLTVLSL